MKNCLLIVALLSGLATSAQQIEKSLTSANNVFIGFLEYKPTDYNANPNTKYPLIIFMHGIGERGNGTTQLQNVASNAIPRYIKDGDPMKFTWNGKTETFLVLSPQLSNNYSSWQPFYVEEMIKYAKQNLRIDTNRIIVTGLSLGGGGVWKYAGGSVSNAKNLAAIAAVCATCENVPWANIANANLPAWGFHAQDDNTTSANCTNGAVTAIRNANPNLSANLTIWPTGQHWIWDRAYDRGYAQQNPNVYEWFLAQNKSLPMNKRPVANAGADASTTTGNGSITLNASATKDADGNIVRYVWRMVSGPTQVKFPADLSAATQTVTGLTVAGTYTFELKAVDNRADWSTDEVVVTVTTGGSATPPAAQPQQPTQPTQPTTNSPVVVKAGADQTITLPATLTLDGSGTTDPDGPVKQYEWVKVSGPACTITSVNSAKTTVTNLNAGVYTFKLTAWGDNWAPKNDEVVVTVKAAPVVVVNNAPVAIAGSSVSMTLPENVTSLNGAASYDNDGSIAAYSWTKIAGPAQCNLTNANAANATAANLAQGTYSFRLQVTDDKNAVSADTVSVTVKAAPATGNQPIVTNAGADMTITLPVNRAILDGSATADPDGETKAYQWRKISGPAAGTITDAKSMLALASSLVEGTYKFELMAWGDNWVPRADTVVVTVKAPASPANVAPVVSAGGGVVINLPLNNVTLNGAASYDMDGTIVSYVWSKVSGPAQHTIVDAAAATTSVINLVAGTYRFRLQATDNSGAFNADTVTVQVNAPANSPVVAKAGDDMAITLPTNSVTVDGSASYDVDGEVKAHQWRKISGPEAYTIANSKSAKTMISNLVAGTYKFELMAWGDNWVPRADTMTITVGDAVLAAVRTNNASTRISESLQEPAVKVFPSPATDVINIQYQDSFRGEATAVIYDISGKIVSQIKFNKDQAVYQRTVNVSNFQPGVYHMTVISKDKKLVTNFVKQ